MGHIVISMDSHTELVADLKPYLARKWYDEFKQGEVLAQRYFSSMINSFAAMMTDAARADQQPFSTLLPPSERPPVVEEYMRPMPMKERLALIDADGVAAEFITPFIGAFSDSPEFLHECNLAYHRYFADYISPAPYRFTGSTVANLVCGVQTVLEEIDDAYRHGLRALSMPGKVSFVSRDLPTYNARFYDPIWAALAERGMAAVFHAGFGREKPLLRWDGRIWPWSTSGQGEPGWELLVQDAVSFGEFEYLKYLLAGSVPERFPSLRIGILESGAHWIPEVIRQVDFYWNAQTKLGSLNSYRGKLSPLEQWHRQCFVSTTLDARELELRHLLGVSNLMWGSDFPHVEGTYPHTREHLAKLFAGISPGETEAIIGGNAARMMGFDLAKLAQTPAAQAPWPGF
jgi:predicted TIM-barrel fold metal-dependent hydrolase